MDSTTVINHVQLSEPLDAAAIAEAKAIRWQWVVLYNRLKNTAGGGAQHAHALDMAEQCIEIIDAILEANPTIN